ncbi:hypothetical protein SK128_010508 [Halocaridina rubra]|uniref:Xanthine dehydrogenase n=1 Tax=Halocaridina rubra TaxID=373956 RepID=A0AAN8WFC5_HALRR
MQKKGISLNCPVRIALDRSEDMVITGKRHSYLCQWKVSFNDDGVFSALSMDVYANGGCTADYSAGVIQKAMLCMDSAYKCDNTLVRGYACKTHLPSNTACRGTGGPQGTFFSEDIISRVAAYLKKDANEIREKNLYHTGDFTHYNQSVDTCTVHQCWDEVIEQANYSERKADIERFNRENRYRKRGLSTVPLKYGVSFPTRVLMQAGALVLVYTDGSVLLSHGGIEMGQGLHTKMIQVASRVLQIPTHKIHITDTATDKVPNTSPSAASSSSDLNGMAVKDACEKIIQRLEPYVTQNPTGSWEDWVKAAYFDRVSLSAAGFYKWWALVECALQRTYMDNEGSCYAACCLLGIWVVAVNDVGI